MQYLGATSEMTEWSQFVSKANHSTSQWSKSMPQPLILKKLKLIGSVKTYSIHCSLLGSSVDRIFQARIQEWVTISFSRGSSWPRDRTWVSCTAGRLFTVWATREVLKILYRTNSKKKIPFHHMGLECKSRKSRDTQNNRQVWPWSTKWRSTKANRVLSREHAGHSKPLFQQLKRRLYTWTSPDGQYQNQIDYVLCSWRWRSSIKSAKTRPGADWGSDHELFIAKFGLKLKKEGKTTRPFRYDLIKSLMIIQWW